LVAKRSEVDDGVSCHYKACDEQSSPDPELVVVDPVEVATT
jgi:hypothetical protein